MNFSLFNFSGHKFRIRLMFKLVIIILTLLYFIFLFLTNGSEIEYAHCENRRNIWEHSIYGIYTDEKFSNINHKVSILGYIETSNSQFILQDPTKLFFDNTELGDSIAKDANSLSFKVFRKGSFICEIDETKDCKIK